MCRNASRNDGVMTGKNSGLMSEHTAGKINFHMLHYVWFDDDGHVDNCSALYRFLFSRERLDFLTMIYSL